MALQPVLTHGISGRLARRSVLICVAMTSGTVGCCPGIVFTRCFTPDSEYLIWMEPWTVKKTHCESGRTTALGDGDFALSRDGKYVLIVPSDAWWQSGNSVKLVRLTDGKRWCLPSLPGLDDPRYFAPRTPANLTVDSVDDMSLSFSFIFRALDSF